MNQSNEIVPVTNRGVVLAGGNVCDAVISALDETRIPDSIQGTNRVDAERERARQVLDIFALYFTGGFRTFTRADVGRHIHPADTPMKLALSTYTKGVLLLPPNERFACFTPLQFLLSAIGETWHDAETAALNVRACLDEVRDRVREHGTHPITKEAAAQWYADFDKLKQTLRDELKALSAKLSDTSADHADNTQRTLSAIMQEIHAARGDIAAVGADAHAGRVAAEKLANELEGWREWIALCIRKGGGNKTDQAQADAPQMFVAVRDAIYQLWQRFNAEPADCEMRDGSLRKPGQKRTYAECVEQYGATVVYTSPVTGRKYYLSEYCGNAEELEKTINAARMAENRKHGAKNSPHKRRTRKRQK